MVNAFFVGNLKEIGCITAVADENKIFLRYCFFPNLDVYFEFNTEEFIYKEAGKWIRKIHILSSYSGFGL